VTKKLEKRPIRSLVKSSESEEEEWASVQIEAFDEEVHSKRAIKSGMAGLQA